MIPFPCSCHLHLSLSPLSLCLPISHFAGAPPRPRRRRPTNFRATSNHLEFCSITMGGKSQLNPDASPFIPSSLSLFAYKDSQRQAESSSMDNPSARTSHSSPCEENDMDPLALTKSVLSMFPNISEEFINELLQANEFDINLTVDMLHELNSQNMLHDDAIMGLPKFPDIKNLQGNLGLPDGDVSQSNSSLDQSPQKDMSVMTSGVKFVSPLFSDINLLHDNLGLPEDDKPAITSTTN
uniref:CUE domain-containing protein n=1 Tax=Leersia perrieri TaxID=77586 RepID=A0A0D9WTX7_9ORYZ